MRESIDLGLDFGSIFFRGAYMFEGEVIPVPISRSERVWSGAIYYPGTWAGEPLLFESLKSSLGLASQVVFGSKAMTVEDRVRDLLAHFKADVEEYAGSAVRRVTIAVPGYYAEAQRAATREIASEAGFQQVELVDDCQAAALGYTTLAPVEQPLCLLVFSMGFMGFEAVLLRVDRQGCHKISERGGLWPSGRDVDRLLMEACIAEAEQRNMPLPFLENAASYAWRDLRDLVETAKKRLGLGENAQITLPASLTGRLPLPMLLRVTDFDAAMQGYVNHTTEMVREVLAGGGVGASDVDKVLLVGGTTRLPGLQAGLEALFGPKLIQPRENLLARGAAVQVAAAEGSAALGMPASREVAEQSAYATLDLRSPQRPSRGAGSRPTPQAILNYARRLVDAGDYEAAIEYLDEILASIRAARIDLEGRRFS